MIRARGQIRIERPPDAVFDFLADLSNEPQGAFRLATPLLIPLMRWTMQKQRAPKIKQAVERA